MNIRTFINEEAHRLWHGKQLKDSLHQLSVFCNHEGFGEREISNFVPKDIYNFMDTLIDSGKSKSTANRYLSAISKVFNHATDMELIEHSPKVKWFKTDTARPRFFSDDEIKKIKDFFANHKHSWMREIFIIGLQTGMRLGEIVEIGSSAVVETCSKTQDKWLYLPQTKNGDARYVPLNKVALKAINKLGGRVKDHYSHRKFYSAWADCKYAVAKNDKDFVFHVTRHTCATRMANDLNAHTLLIGKLLGHRSQATTAKYVKGKTESLKEIADLMGQYA